jgi:hypothetical protein
MRADLETVRKSAVISAGTAKSLKEFADYRESQQPIRRGIAVKGTAMNVSHQK